MVCMKTPRPPHSMAVQLTCAGTRRVNSGLGRESVCLLRIGCGGTYVPPKRGCAANVGALADAGDPGSALGQDTLRGEGQGEEQGRDTLPVSQGGKQLVPLFVPHRRELRHVDGHQVSGVVVGHPDVRVGPCASICTARQRAGGSRGALRATTRRSFPLCLSYLRRWSTST